MRLEGSRQMILGESRQKHVGAKCGGRRGKRRDKMQGAAVTFWVLTRPDVTTMAVTPRLVARCLEGLQKG